MSAVTRARRERKGWSGICLYRAAGGASPPRPRQFGRALVGLRPRLARGPGVSRADDREVLVRPQWFGFESDFRKPLELIVKAVGEVDDPVDFDLRVLWIVWDDDVAEHERAAWLQHVVHAPEEIALAGPVEMVDGERRDDEVERSRRQRVLEPAQVELGRRQSFARAGEHRLVGVDRSPARIRMLREHASRRLAGADAELERRAHVETVRRRRDALLQLDVPGNVREHQLEVRIRIPVDVRHCADLSPDYAARVAFASVYPLVTARSLAREFTYEVPDDVRPGAVVEVRFGNARRRGVVTEIGVSPPPGIEAAPVERVVEDLPPALVELALWVASYYGSTPGRALALVAPVKRKARGTRPRPAERDALPGEAPPAELSDSQRISLDRIVGAIDTGSTANILLHGATGSGKTEVYLQSCAAALERGRGAIVLVPEIALTPQTVGRFTARFGDRIAILHSALSEAERRDERARIASGDAQIVVGARSAIFAPVPRLGVICVDEEHDPSYKQESDPRYDARTVAAKRAALEGAVAVFGSATPRPESWGTLERLELGGRLAGPLPPVRVVDLRREAGYPLSAPLLAELGAIAERGGKAILLLNRRGVAPALHCRACGVTLRCVNCDVALVLHRDQALRCHHCGHAEPEPRTCPACGSAELARLGAGTQRLERELEAKVPELERIRLDADAVEKPGSLAAALSRFAEADRAVLVGTQMVAKGHHFSGVALAAVVDADTGLGLPDFRAEERTFQLLTQLAGRSGRDAPGRVLVQTFQPDARAIALAANHDVERFLSGELERRRELGYPPFRHLVRIVVSGPEPDAPLQALAELRAALSDDDVIGPAPLLRLRGRYRAQLVAKTGQPRRIGRETGRLLSAAAPAMRRHGLTAVVDIDPQNL